MSTTTTESPDFASLPFSMGKSPSSLYMPPSTSAYGGHHASIGASGNGACGFAANSEFTNLTPMLSGNGYPGSTNGDSSNPSSASSSRTRLVNLGHDDSGLSGFSSTDGSVLMGYGSPQMDIKMEEDLEAMPRDRCNTWPMRRPTLDINGQTSPMIHDRIPEEDIYDSGENLSHSTMTNRSPNNGLSSPQSNSFSTEFGNTLSLSPGSPQDGSGSPEANGSTKNKTTRRNAWGNLSYADLITQAILSSPEKRLTLSQVYEWMVTNVSYFRDKGDSNSSAGWKNSIRHNLSLHNRFMRIQNEGAGKSSWWVINPDAKPGRNPRRRAQTMEGATKASLDKSRRKARSKRSDLGIPLHSANSSAIGSTASILSNSHVYNDQDDALNANFDTFRPRTQSNISVPANSHRMSPTRYDDFDFPPCWADGLTPGNSNPELNDILGRTDQMRLNSDAADYRNCALKNPNPMVNGLNGMPKMEIKSEMPSPHHSIAPPPPYTASQPMPPMGNQMMRGGPPSFTPQQQQHMQNQGMQGMQQPRMQQQNNFSGMSNGYYQPPMYMSNGMNGMNGMSSQQQQPSQSPWQQQSQSFGGMGLPPTTSHHNQCPSSLFDSHGSNGALPVDLENLNLPDSSMMDMEFDVEAVLRHEMAQNQDGSINFEL